MRRKAYRNEIFSMWESVMAKTWYEKSQGDNTMVDLTELEIDGEYSRDDVITINRADLPEVTESGYSIHCGGSDYFTDPEFGAAKHRQWALQQLAVAEFLEARDKATQDVERSRIKRRDELAEKFAPGSGWNRLTIATQRAIDYIIELEDSTHE